MTDTKNRKLVFFDFVTHFGGAQQCTVRLCEELVKKYEVHAVDAYGCCREYLDAMASINVPVHVLMPQARSVVIGNHGRKLRRIMSILKQLPALLTLRRRALREIARIQPDLVWTNSTKALAALAMSSKNYSAGLYAHGWYRKEQVSSWGRFLVRNCTDFVFAVSNATRESLESWGVEAGKIHVVFNTIEFEAILAGAARKAGDLPGLDKNFKILVPGLLIRSKGQYVAVKAAAILKRKGVDFTMWLAGDAAMEDKSGYVEMLRGIIAENNLEGNVHLLGWRNNVWAIMNAADVVVLPTHTEGLPRAVQESMILRRPVISTAVGGVPDLIIDNETGLLMPIDDEDVLAKHLERLCRDRAFAVKLAKNGFDHMYKHFSIGRHMELIYDAIKSIVDKNRRDEGMVCG